jgi:HAD superfamily hydrolase (TIGR01490 family)
MTNEPQNIIVFDIDGTILPGISFERLLVEHLFQKKILRPRHAFYFMRRGFTLLFRSLTSVTKANKGYLRNFSVDYMTKLGEDFFNISVAPRISKTAVERIKLHQKNGDRVILLSGMPDFLCQNFARHLGVTEFNGSVTEIKDGKFTGKTLGPFPLGKGKIEALEEIIVGQPLANWSAVTFYGDHWLDRFLLAKVGHPVAVNPKEKLLQLAKEKGWQVEWWG